jgi:hypothetical protein
MRMESNRTGYIEHHIIPWKRLAVDTDAKDMSLSKAILALFSRHVIGLHLRIVLDRSASCPLVERRGVSLRSGAEIITRIFSVNLHNSWVLVKKVRIDMVEVS